MLVFSRWSSSNVRLEFQGQLVFFFLYCILFITKVKLFQGAIGRNSFEKSLNHLTNACVLTATLLVLEVMFIFRITLTLSFIT